MISRRFKVAHSCVQVTILHIGDDVESMIS